MNYENIIYLKNGNTIHQESDISLAEQATNVKNWNEGTILLSNKNQMLIPKRNIQMIETKIRVDGEE